MSRAALPPAVLDPRLLPRLLDHALREAPRECCGVLTLAGPAAHPDSAYVAAAGSLPLRYHPARNRATSASLFEMDPDDLLAVLDGPEADAARLWGLFHSHVRHEAVPSEVDRANAYYPDAVYLILSLKPRAQPGLGLRLEGAVLRGFSIRDGQAEEVPLTLARSGGAPPPPSTDSAAGSDS